MAGRPPESQVQGVADPPGRIPSLARPVFSASAVARPQLDEPERPFDAWLARRQAPPAHPVNPTSSHALSGLGLASSIRSGRNTSFRKQVYTTALRSSIGPFFESRARTFSRCRSTVCKEKDSFFRRLRGLEISRSWAVFLPSSPRSFSGRAAEPSPPLATAETSLPMCASTSSRSSRRLRTQPAGPVARTGLPSGRTPRGRRSRRNGRTRRARLEGERALLGRSPVSPRRMVSWGANP